MDIFFALFLQYHVIDGRAQKWPLLVRFGFHAPWTISVNVTSSHGHVQCSQGFDSMLVKRLAAYTLHLQPFPSNSTPKSENGRFYHILISHEYAPGTIAVNVTWMEREFNACKTSRTINPSNYRQSSRRSRYCWEIATFSYPLHLVPPLRVTPFEFRGKV